MKKRLGVALLSLVLCFGLGCSCSPNGHPLPEGMEESTVLEQGRTIISQLNDGEYTQVYEQLREDAQALSPEESIASYMESTLEQAGAYQSESDAMATGQTLDDTGEEYGTAVFYCKHEKKDVLYRIAFDLDMNLMGLEIKIE